MGIYFFGGHETTYVNARVSYRFHTFAEKWWFHTWFHTPSTQTGFIPGFILGFIPGFIPSLSTNPPKPFTSWRLQAASALIQYGRFSLQESVLSG